MTWADDIKAKTQQMRDMVRQAQADRCDWDPDPDPGAALAIYQASMAQIMDHDVGPFMDIANQIDAIVNTTNPVPAPVVTRGRAGSYVQHDPAVDGYLGGDWGPHTGIPLLAPSAGRVELYTFPTPLPAASRGMPSYNPVYAQHHQELFSRPGNPWVCIMSLQHLQALGAGQQTMYVFVFWPDTPIINLAPVPIKWIGGGHVDGSSVRVGRVNTGDLMANTGASGIQFEKAGFSEARAGHWHAICGASSTLSPNGDLSGYYAIRALGFPDPVHEGKPGPNDYEQIANGRSRYCAGRLRSAWPATQPIPPLV